MKSELAELKEFRRKLVRARRLVVMGEAVADAPLIDAGMKIDNCQIIMHGKRVEWVTASEFHKWCYDASENAIHQMYTNSIAALDARIAELEQPK